MKTRLLLTLGLTASIACSADDTSRTAGPGLEGDDLETVMDASCEPRWDKSWIGSPCTEDADCTFDGGACILPEDGFQCGTCTSKCEKFCPDANGTPVTFCIDGSDVDLAASGTCLSKCDSKLLDGNGCRDGYGCEVLSRVDESAAAGVCVPDEFDTDDKLVDKIDHPFLIDHLGGEPVDPFDFDAGVDGFQKYLDAVGVQHFSAKEIVAPHNAGAAAGCGLSILLPKRGEWERIGALALFADELRELVGEPIYLRNWWRPPCYNSAVGGAANGDHPDGDAVDLDFQSAKSRAKAQKHLCENYWSKDIVSQAEIAPGSGLNPRLNMSVGLGGVSIHLGVLSDKGRRSWKYASYSNQPNDGNCW